MMQISNQNFKSIFQDLQTDQFHKDIKIVCKNGTLYAHRVLLATGTPFLKGFLKDPAADLIILPDFPLTVVSRWLGLVYAGELLSEELDLHGFDELVTALSISGGGDNSRSLNAVPNGGGIEEALLVDQNIMMDEEPMIESDPLLATNDGRHGNVEVMGIGGTQLEDILEVNLDEGNESTRTEDVEMEEQEEAEVGEERVSVSDIMKSLSAPKHNTKKRVYRCYVCFSEFHSTSALLAHAKSHQGKLIYRCNLCLKPFSNVKQVHSHKKRPCNSDPVASKAKKPSHLSHHKPKPKPKNTSAKAGERYTCLQCGDSLSSDEALRAHYRHCAKRHASVDSVEDPDVPQLPPRNLNKCPVCFKAFLTSSALNLHLDDAHSDPSPSYNGDEDVEVLEVVTRYTCLMCKRKFQSDKELMEHRELHGDRTVFTCEFCADTFHTELDYHKHVTTHPTGSHVTHKCLVCEKVLSRRQSLVAHMRVHYILPVAGTASKPQPSNTSTTPSHAIPPQSAPFQHYMQANNEHQCSVCSQSFPALSDLEYHHTSHPLNFPFQCNRCKNSYSTAKELLSHPCRAQTLPSAAPHPPVQSRKLPSPHTPPPPPTFSQPTPNTAPMQDEHPERANSKNPTFCFVCHRDLGSYVMYVHHKKSHPSGSRYRCDVCFRSYATAHDCHQHRSQHFSAMIYACHLCNRSYPLKPALNNHLRKSHGILQGRQSY